MENLWVASLGDSDAVCARREEGNSAPIFLSEQRNCSNPAELERMRAEHPNEDHAVVHDAAVLGCLRVTRSLGDHQLKVPLLMASRIMPYFYPALMAPTDFETLSSRCSSPLRCSRGLTVFVTLLPFSDKEKFPILLALANGEADTRLGHECIVTHDGDNLAVRVIENEQTLKEKPGH